METLKRTLHKAVIFFKSRINIWTIIVLHKTEHIKSFSYLYFFPKHLFTASECSCRNDPWWFLGNKIDLRSPAVSRSNTCLTRQYKDGETNESLEVVAEKLKDIMITNRQQKKITDYFNLWCKIPKFKVRDSRTLNLGAFQFKPLQGGHLFKADKNFCPVSVRFREVPL